ncbi:hypothetical protein K491DRAFT_215864 [Lophiostoma macrostomum CBS 122681]|uniref:Uncharacterized protein n=1 Tax=Lophiostoma macrostomum CBS 122681 TaxID=1314788 RepID=A0A6A6TI42_9PLEO|nr:hypothetical protein K491DRAFT_215864 [Lophiostoma macrostomum CBS 122681]
MADQKGLERKRASALDIASEDTERVKRIKSFDDDRQKLDHEAGDIDDQIAALKGRKKVVEKERVQAEARFELECNVQCHKLASAIIEAFPREIRDVIYGHIYETPNPAVCGKVDVNVQRIVCTLGPATRRDAMSSFIDQWKSPMSLREECVGEQFASEMVEVWYKMTHLRIHGGDLAAFLEDELGVLYAVGAPWHAQLEHIRSLTVVLQRDLPDGDANDPLRWQDSDELREDRAALKCLLGPFGVKHKRGFQLTLHIRVSCELHLERWLETLGPVIYACKAEGFVVNVEHAHYPARPVYDSYDSGKKRWEVWQLLSGKWKARSKVVNASRRFDRPFEEWMERAQRNCYLAKPPGSMSTKRDRLPADSQYDVPAVNDYSRIR